jgi:hypothetical protein
LTLSGRLPILGEIQQIDLPVFQEIPERRPHRAMSPADDMAGQQQQ